MFRIGERYFRRLAASLTPGGRLAVIDFKLDSQSTRGSSRLLMRRQYAARPAVVT